MKNLLIGYTTLVAFIVLTMISAMILPSYTPSTKANTSAPRQDGTLNSFTWVFDFMTHGQQVKLLESGSPTLLKLGVSHKVNTEDYPVDAIAISSVTVMDPYVTGENDLQVGLGKALVLDDTNPGVNDSFRGGDFIFTVNSGSLRKVEFDLIDFGDENDQHLGGSRFNNHYLKVFFKDGTTTQIGLDAHDKSNFPDKYVRHVDTMMYSKDIAKFVVHVSGSTSLDNLKVYSPVVPTSTPPTIPTSTATPKPTSTATPKPTSTATPTPTNKPLVCTQWTTQRLYSGEFNASKPDRRNFNLGTIEFTNVAKKYPIKVRTLWGWTGATENNPQIGDAFNPRVQNEEDHTVTFKYIDNQSTATKALTMKCEDLGNTKSWNDGVELQDIDDPKSEYNKFKYCRQNISSEEDDGSPRSLDYIYLEGKYDKIQINSKLDMTPSEYATCVDKYSARKCNQSHYSLVEVVTCAKEG